MGKCQNDKKRIKSHFRYYHFHTVCGKKGHTKFVRRLDFLEGLVDESFDKNTNSDKEIWAKILKAINKLNCSQVADLIKLLDN